jgi:hypothetical protein
MKPQELLNQILGILSIVKENHEKLQKILLFLEDEIYKEPEEPEVPEKYIKVIPGIADSIDGGFVCFLNSVTHETEDIPEMMLNDPEEFEMLTGESLETSGLKYMKWGNYIQFDPLESHEAFKIMEQFADKLNDPFFKKKIIRHLKSNQTFCQF